MQAISTRDLKNTRSVLQRQTVVTQLTKSLMSLSSDELALRVKEAVALIDIAESVLTGLESVRFINESPLVAQLALAIVNTEGSAEIATAVLAASAGRRLSDEMGPKRDIRLAQQLR